MLDRLERKEITLEQFTAELYQRENRGEPNMTEAASDADDDDKKAAAEMREIDRLMGERRVRIQEGQRPSSSLRARIEERVKSFCGVI